MILKKLRIILSIILIIFASSISVVSAFNTEAPPPVSNEYIKELEIIDNNMYLLIKSIATRNFDEDKIIKQIKFIETLINNLSLKTAKLSQEDNDVILAMQAILNYYKISNINIKDYLNNKDADELIDSITSFSLGYNSSSNLRKIIGEARQWVSLFNMLKLLILYYLNLCKLLFAVYITYYLLYGYFQIPLTLTLYHL